jgi:hypothetical protein
MSNRFRSIAGDKKDGGSDEGRDHRQFIKNLSRSEPTNFSRSEPTVAFSQDRKHRFDSRVARNQTNLGGCQSATLWRLQTTRVPIVQRSMQFYRGDSAEASEASGSWTMAHGPLPESHGSLLKSNTVITVNHYPKGMDH